MNITEDIFSGFVDPDEEFNLFLLLLKERMPDSYFQIISDNGKSVSIGEGL